MLKCAVFFINSIEPLWPVPFSDVPLCKETFMYGDLYVRIPLCRETFM